MSGPYNTSQGVRYPPGAKTGADGVNFSVFSRHATQVELLLLFLDLWSTRQYTHVVLWSLVEDV